MTALLDQPLSPVQAAPAKAKVLIIDDDYGPRESLRILLKYDYEVVVASSVMEGLAALEAHLVDTIILDNRMPGRTGLEGLADIRKIDDEVSIIMLTGYGTIETACEAFRNQATDFMTKPPDTDAMLEAVAKNVSLSRAKRARNGLSRELAELNLNLNAELNETRPLAKLGQRSDEIIHDMGNPLTILTCCIELLQTKVDEMKPEEDTQWMETLGYIGMIKKSIQHCCGLTDTWRQLRDDISQDREATAAGPFVNEAIGSLQPLANMMEIDLQTDLTGLGDVSINIDVVQMRRVVHNLMINAMQATATGQGKVKVQAGTKNGMFELSVTDNGAGIPADRLSMIFEPYYSTKENGTGLGLAISKRIATEHEGTLQAESEVGRGSTFTVTLPLKGERLNPSS